MYLFCFLNWPFQELPCGIIPVKILAHKNIAVKGVLFRTSCDWNNRAREPRGKLWLVTINVAVFNKDTPKTVELYLSRSFKTKINN